MLTTTVRLALAETVRATPVRLALTHLVLAPWLKLLAARLPGAGDTVGSLGEIGRASGRDRV